MAAKLNSTQEHSQIYLQWKQGRFHETLFLPQTYLGFEEDVRCQPLSENSSQRRNQYLELLRQRNIGCSGSWCIDGEFKCQFGNSQDCYNLEHIVDLQNSILEEYNRNIVGNIVMAYGRWNQQVGSLTWPRVEAEKIEIYGRQLMEEAMLAIVECGEKALGPPPSEPEVPEPEVPEPQEPEVPMKFLSGLTTSDWIGIVCGSFILSVLAVLLVLVSRIRLDERADQGLLPQADPDLSSEADQQEVSDVEQGEPELNPEFGDTDPAAVEPAPLASA